MVLTELGISIEVKFVQFQKEQDPMVVTEFGRVTEVKPVHSVNA